MWRIHWSPEHRQAAAAARLHCWGDTGGEAALQIGTVSCPAHSVLGDGLKVMKRRWQRSEKGSTICCSPGLCSYFLTRQGLCSLVWKHDICSLTSWGCSDCHSVPLPSLPPAYFHRHQTLALSGLIITMAWVCIGQEILVLNGLTHPTHSFLTCKTIWPSAELAPSKSVNLSSRSLKF